MSAHDFDAMQRDFLDGKGIIWFARRLQHCCQPQQKANPIRLTAFLAHPATFVLLTAPAFASPAEDMAKARIASIAKGDLAAITSAYANAATLNWVGGPLDGTYAGPDKMKEIWTKFTTAQGEQEATVAAITEAANPKGATITADVAFADRNTVKVRCVMVYRDGKLADEIWQVNPSAAY